MQQPLRLLMGNTYCVLDTRRLLEEGVEATGKAAEDAQMTLNHKEAMRFLVDDVEDIALDAMTVCNLHALERSCKRYEAVRTSLGEPDPFLRPSEYCAWQARNEERR